MAMIIRLSFSFVEPVSELAVCLSPMYGKQTSWLPIVDFVEHHKLEGVTQFYFYVGEISVHDEKILNDYVRTGEMEVIKMQDKYKRAVFGNSDPGIGEILIQVMSIVKDKDYPAKYKNSKELENELIFKKYNQSLTPIWKGKKAIVRSDKIGIMSVHYAIAKYPGIKTLFANSTLAVLRHLRSTKHRINGSAWHLTPNENGTLPIFREVPLPPTFSETLREAIIKRVQFVYKTIPVNRSTIPSHLANMINHPDPCSKPWPDF
ncbi:Protein CBG00446 [Caenorhabditis briggsae]|uniref:Glycosyltransferase family 92 protein n=2 Tax=Caenorhabditis briggsae TaxID=6238 RepID=A8WN40_CAEBR|nr:Protein CBG00446 [Caenorhabditis briggsae]CAP21895.2 Protein CBG00446 [Caenorhabditis briggsae]